MSMNTNFHSPPSAIFGNDFTGITFYEGQIIFYSRGLYHRENGPAVQHSDGYTEWYIRGKIIKTWREYHKLSTLTPQEQMVVKLKYGEQLE